LQPTLRVSDRGQADSYTLARNPFYGVRVVRSGE
jgi:hypothetical protein